MKKIFLAVFVLVCLYGCDKLNFDSKEANYKLQEMCSKSAKDFFKNLYPDCPSYICSYENHYNKKMNKCFIFTEDIGRYPGQSRTRYLYDVHEYRRYGSLMGDAGWYFLPEGNHDDVRKDKWFPLIKPYMEE